MGRSVTPSGAQGRALKKQQVFTVSGTFTPSQALLDAGGVVEVRCIGGGGGGGSSAGGSSGMDITRLVVVTGPTTVTIGAGGQGASGQGVGGQTRFGTLLAALGGNRPSGYQGGRSSGEGSHAGESAFMANSIIQPGGGGGGGGGGNSSGQAALPNTGGGGAGSQSYPGHGGSGLCIVTWEE